jgi:uncharacterized membrane protein
MLRRRHPSATQSTRRLEAFTDGVFAIAATLLVLDLTSHSVGEVGSDGDLWSALLGMHELFFNFALSFVLLCLLWMFHAAQFEDVQRVDQTVMWLNNGRLLFVVLVPFATSLTTEYSEWVPGRLAMPIAFGMAIILSWLQYLWLASHRDQMMPDVSEADARGNVRGALSAVIISIVVITAAPFIGSAAFLLFLLDRPLTRVLRGRGTTAGGSSGAAAS